MVAETEDQVFTLREAATFLRVSPATLKRYVAEGRVAYRRLGPRYLRFLKSDLLESLAHEDVKDRGKPKKDALGEL